VTEALAGVDAVIHLAAEVGVGQSMYEIARYVGANDLGTAVLLEAMIGTPVKRIVVASSMSVYGEGLYADAQGRRFGNIRRQADTIKEGRWTPLGENGAELIPVPTDESKPVDLASIYALTKYAQERQVLIFGEAYGIDAVALRLFNVFGPGQALSNPYTGVLANFASRLANGQRPMIFEDGEQRRDFVYVGDVARAFCEALVQPSAAGEVFNIGSGHDRSVTEVANSIARAMGRDDIDPEIVGKSRVGDIRHCFCDGSKAADRLGFSAQKDFDEGLAELAEWVAEQEADDRVDEARAELEAKGLVA
jgi:dTDP-L-rhamnose 4-epimerase